MQNTIHAHTNPYFTTHIFNVNIRRPKLIRLINQKIKNLLRRNGIKCLRNRRNRLRIALTTNLNIVIMHFYRRVVAKHEYLICRTRNKEEIHIFTIITVALAHLFNKRSRRLARHHKLIAYFTTTFLQRNNIILVHLFYRNKLLS